MTTLLTIDGSMGEGGGQIVRSSLALSLVTGRPVEIVNIRAGRPKPGLRRQHLTAVNAAAQVAQAEVAGGDLGSSRLTFRPGTVQPGEYRFPVGTAGSTSLVLQTVLPALLLAKGPSTLTLEGGTHNPHAPPFEFLQRAYLPFVDRMGPHVTATLERAGFYPAGGGRISVRIQPTQTLRPVHLTERGAVLKRRVRAIVARLPRHIAERECRTLRTKTGWDAGWFEIEEIEDSAGPGNVLLVELESEHVTEVFTAFGERGKPAEQVAREAVRQVKAYLDAGVPVGPFLADQMLLPMGVAAFQGAGGGEFRTLPLTRHSLTHVEVLRQFLDTAVRVEPQEHGACLVQLT